MVVVLFLARLPHHINHCGFLCCFVVSDRVWDRLQLHRGQNVHSTERERSLLQWSPYQSVWTRRWILVITSGFRVAVFNKSTRWRQYHSKIIFLYQQLYTVRQLYISNCDSVFTSKISANLWYWQKWASRRILSISKQCWPTSRPSSPSLYMGKYTLMHKL